MSQTAHLQIDPEPLQSLRELLGDTDKTAIQFTDMRLMDCLRDNRQTVQFRNPLIQAVSQIYYINALYGRNRQPVPMSEMEDSFLVNEPGLRSFQAKRHVRHWDSQSSVTVYQSGLQKTAGTDYSINYPEGRITFTADVQDYEPVNASFSYYPIYRCVEQLLSWYLASGKAVVAEKFGNDSWTYGGVTDRLKAIQAVLGDFAPKQLRQVQRVY